jgi:hypothetical protein
MKDTAERAACPGSGQSNIRSGRATPEMGNPPLGIPVIRIQRAMASHSGVLKLSMVKYPVD